MQFVRSGGLLTDLRKKGVSEVALSTFGLPLPHVLPCFAFLDAFPVEFCIRDFGIGFYTSLATRAWADMPEGRPPRDLRHCS